MYTYMLPKHDDNTNTTITHFLFPLVCYIEVLLIGVTELL
jgi:hypothetical protein